MAILFFLLLLCLLIFIIVLTLIFLLQLTAIITTDVPFVPIPQVVEPYITESLSLEDHSVLYDLGCGDGRVLIAAVQKYPMITAVGVEKNLVPYLLAKWKTRKFPQIKIRFEDIFKTDLSSATHIFTYLYPKVMKRLYPRISRQCRKGVVLVSGDFGIEGVEPASIIETKSASRGKKLYVYVI